MVGQSVEYFFDSIPHAALLQSVARRVVDRRMLGLMKRWLKGAVEETDGRGRKTRTTVNRDTGRGVPQGSLPRRTWRNAILPSDRAATMPLASLVSTSESQPSQRASSMPPLRVIDTWFP